MKKIKIEKFLYIYKVPWRKLYFFLYYTTFQNKIYVPQSFAIHKHNRNQTDRKSNGAKVDYLPDNMAIRSRRPTTIVCKYGGLLVAWWRPPSVAGAPKPRPIVWQSQRAGGKKGRGALDCLPTYLYSPALQMAARTYITCCQTVRSMGGWWMWCLNLIVMLEGSILLGRWKILCLSINMGFSWRILIICRIYRWNDFIII